MATTFGSVTLYAGDNPLTEELGELVRQEPLLPKSGATASEDMLYPQGYPREKFTLEFDLVSDSDYNTLKGWAKVKTSQTLTYQGQVIGTCYIASFRSTRRKWHGQLGAGGYIYRCEASFLKTT